MTGYERDLVAIDQIFLSTRALVPHVLGPKRARDIPSLTCDACGVTHDRDANASQDNLAASLAVRAGPIPGDGLWRGRQARQVQTSAQPRSNKNL